MLRPCRTMGPHPGLSEVVPQGSGLLPELMELPHSALTPGSTVAKKVAQAAAGPSVAAARLAQQGCRAVRGPEAATLGTATGLTDSPQAIRDEPPKLPMIKWSKIVRWG
jgi:thiazole synthase ThiGH ThiG subunit